jgi:hypothetical protein
MRDARYLRAQAELCLEMARQVSDRATADNLRAEAARYHAEAAEIETGVKTWELKEPRSRIDSSIEGVDVRFGSLADISQCNRHVRFTPESGHSLCDGL